MFYPVVQNKSSYILHCRLQGKKDKRSPTKRHARRPSRDKGNSDDETSSSSSSRDAGSSSSSSSEELDMSEMKRFSQFMRYMKVSLLKCQSRWGTSVTVLCRNSDQNINKMLNIFRSRRSQKSARGVAAVAAVAVLHPQCHRRRKVVER